ncbi:MAG: hypothetical protein F6K35_43830 [Okeania sp. SIO2H7]|nr:hypothetical protein [Okeania sp. SIO2H7]
MKARHKDIIVRFQLNPDVPRHVEVDEVKLRQILMNLLDNAVKFTDSGYVRLKLSVQNIPRLESCRIHQTSDLLWLQFDVEDTGPGIAQDELELLFQAFFQTDSGKRYNGGTGLGLAISKEFIVLMGGDIAVASTLGKGTVFRLDIPIKYAPLPSGYSEPVSEQSKVKYEDNLCSIQPHRRLFIDAAMRNMPSDWKQDLKKAAITGADTKMMVLVSEIPTTFNDLSTTLIKWINDFKFEKIITLIEQAES